MMVMTGLLARYLTDVRFPIRSYLMTLAAVAVGFCGSFLWPGDSLSEIVFKIAMLAGFVALARGLKLVTSGEFAELLEAVAPWRGPQRAL
jgi:hypothetical protein